MKMMVMVMMSGTCMECELSGEMFVELYSSSKGQRRIFKPAKPLLHPTSLPGHMCSPHSN